MEVYRPSGTTSSWRSCLPSHRYVCHAEYRRRQECGLDLNFMLGLRDFRVWESSRFFDSFFFRWPRQRCSAAKSYHKEYTCNSLDGYNDCYNNYPALSAPWSHMLYLLLRTRMKWQLTNSQDHILSEPTCKWSSSHNKRSGEQMLWNIWTTRSQATLAEFTRLHRN